MTAVSFHSDAIIKQISTLPWLQDFSKPHIKAREVELGAELLSMANISKLLGKDRAAFKRELPPNTTLRVKKWGSCVRRLEGECVGLLKVDGHSEKKSTVVFKVRTEIYAVVNQTDQYFFSDTGPRDAPSRYGLKRHVTAAINVESILKIITSGKADNLDEVLEEFERIIALSEVEHVPPDPYTAFDTRISISVQQAEVGGPLHYSVEPRVSDESYLIGTVRPRPTVVPFYGGGLIVRNLGVVAFDEEQLDVGVEWNEWEALSEDHKRIVQNWENQFCSPCFWNSKSDRLLLTSLTIPKD
jgi:hypothetical protein